MPLAIVKTGRHAFSDQEWSTFASDLREIISHALHAPDDEGGALSVSDIEIEYREIGMRDENTESLMVTIFANDFPSRKQNIEERTGLIASGVATIMPLSCKGEVGKQGFVWVLLSPAAFVMF